MFRKKNNDSQMQIHFVTIENLVPQNHLLRLIDRAIDFDFIYDEMKGLYSNYNGGRPGIDPVSLFKIVFIQYLFGIRSMRQTIREIEVNMAYRWFIGYDIQEKIPHFSTFGKNYVRRFQGTDVFERIFERILQEAASAGFIDASAIFIDGTHIKASANRNKKEKIVVTKPVKAYKAELDEEIDRDREKHDKKPLRRDDAPTTTEQTASKTDPDSGLFVKGEHERCFAYNANTACDKNGFVLNFAVDAGNVHDSQMFHSVYGKLTPFMEEAEAIVVDSGYKTPGVMREIWKSGKVPVVPYHRPMTKEGFFKKQDYAYDEYHDCYLCPNNEVLNYSTTNREGYREYKSDAKVCRNCPYLSQCTNSRNHVKVVMRHVWADYTEEAEHYRHKLQYKPIYKQRKETIERVFAEAKERHGLRYATMRGLERVTMQVTLIFCV